MSKLIIKRILMMLPLLWLIATLTFFLLRVLPGGPFDAEKNLPPEIMANLKAKYHMDKPLPEQYYFYLQRLTKGDLGISYKYLDRSVNDILASAFPVSLTLGISALLLAIIIGVPLGVIAATKKGTAIDTACIVLSTLGVSLPSFVIGALLIFVFGIWLKLLPVALWESGWHIILPAFTLASGPTAYLARLTRSSIIEALSKDWVRTARIKGEPYLQTVINHALRNALIPIITVLGPLSAILITGSFVVETIYAIPGMGRFFITAVSNRDYDLVIGTTLIFALLLIIANTIVDILYHILDPRITISD
jgi:oligopeptide transport system permease protein